MSNIRVDLNCPIKDGTEVVFRSPVDCSQVTGLIVYYPGENGITTSKEFAFADAHGNNVGDIDHLFAENVAVKVILDDTTSMAFVQNADTNAYLEAKFDTKVSIEKQTLTEEEQAQARANIGAQGTDYLWIKGDGDIVAISAGKNDKTNGIPVMFAPIRNPSGRAILRNIAPGLEDTDAVNKAQMEAYVAENSGGSGGGGGASVVYISLAYSDDEFFAENASCKEILDYVNDDKNVVLVYEEDGMAVCFYLAAKYEERCEFVCISSLFSFGLKVYATHIERFEPSSSGGVSTFDVYTYWNWDEDVYGGLESSCSYEDIVSAYNNGNIVQLRGYHEDGEVRFYHLVTYMEESHFQFARETLSGTEFISVEWDSNWYISVRSGSSGGEWFPDASFSLTAVTVDDEGIHEEEWYIIDFESGMTWRDFIEGGHALDECCVGYDRFYIDDDDRIRWQSCPECDGMTRAVYMTNTMDNAIHADDEIMDGGTYYIHPY